MMLRESALAPALARARGALPALIWIASDEPLLQIEAADAVRAAARAAGFAERQVFQIERGFRPESVQQEADALSLFSARKLIELRATGKLGKDVGEALATIAERLAEDTRLLLTTPRIDRATQRLAWFGRLAEQGWVVEIPVVERDRLPRWIGERLAARGRSADADTLQAIADRVEGNLLAAHQEVEKLSLLFPEGRLDPKAVRGAVLDVSRWDVFDLVDAGLTGDVPRTLRCLAGLRAEGAVVPALLWAPAEAIRVLDRLVSAREAGRPLAPVLAQARIWGDRERVYGQAARRFDRRRLAALLHACARVDRMSKGVLAGDAWQAFEAVLLGLAGQSPLALSFDPALCAHPAQAA